MSLIDAHARPYGRTPLSRFMLTTLGVVALAVSLAAQGGGGTTPAEAEPRIQVLVVSGGCCHDYAAQAKAWMDVLRDVAPVDWTVVNQGGTARESKIPLYANPDWIKGFDIVIHNECFGFVDDADYIRRIVDAHKTSGTPAVFTHCSMHSYRNTTIDVWRELVGVTSRRHTTLHPIAVQWTTPRHAITETLESQWTTPPDELYVIEKTWPNVTVLATAVSPEPGNATYPIVWTNSLDGVRVFTTTLGHAGTWADPVFQRLLARGFLWALEKQP